MATPFNAIILAIGTHANRRIAGLTLAVRARRVAEKAGAERVWVISDIADLRDVVTEVAAQTNLADHTAHALLVINASSQVVHTPLVAPLLADGIAATRRIATTPIGAYAGALLATGTDAIATITELAAHGSDSQIVAQWGATATTFAHGDIARHDATTPAERKAAEAMLFQLIHKDADGWVTRYLYRPVSRPITRLLLHTPITPNQISGIVGILGLIGCILVARGNYRDLVWGAVLVVIAGYLDGCDGEVARLRHMGSKFGAWLDTIVDELSSLGYIVALGLHVYNRTQASWALPALALGAGCAIAAVYIIYYFDLRVAKTGNSQNYVGALKLVDDPVLGMGLTPVPPTVTTSPVLARVMAVLYAVVRRDFINLACVVMALADVYRFNFLLMVFSTVLMVFVILPEHLRLRRQLKTFDAVGAPIRYVLR